MQIKNLKVFLLSITTAMTLTVGGCSNKKIVSPEATDVKVHSEITEDSNKNYENTIGIKVTQEEINDSETYYQVTVQRYIDDMYDEESFKITSFQELKKFIQEYPNLKRFTMDINSPGESGVLKNISDPKKLKSLTLFCKDVEIDTDKIKDFSNLESLWIENISNLDFLENLKKLQILTLNKANIDEINQIGSLKNLKELTINNSQITNIQALEGLNNLTTLDISNNPNLSDISVLESPSFQKIERLNIGNSKVTDISMLKNLSNLEMLNASYTNITDIAVLRCFPNIESLYLDSANITDTWVLENLPNLKRLSLSKNNIKDFTFLKSLPELVNLELEYTNFADMNLLANNTKLQRLDLAYNNISDVSILLTNTFPELETVYLYYNDISNEQFRELEEAKVIDIDDKTSMSSRQNQAILAVKITKEENTESVYNISFTKYETQDMYGEDPLKSECVQLNGIEAVKKWIEARKGIASLSCEHIDSNEELQILDAVSLPEVLTYLEITKSSSEEIVNHLGKFHNVAALTINAPIPNVDFLKDMKKLEMLIMNADPNTSVTPSEIKQYQNIKWLLLTGFENSADILYQEGNTEEDSLYLEGQMEGEVSHSIKIK